MNVKANSKESKEGTQRVFIVDDHPIVREGLTRLINQMSNGSLTVCGEADNAFDALEGIAKLKPDIAIVDVFLKDQDGIELVADIKKRNSNLPVLVLSMHDEVLYADRALQAGADGYIMKNEKSEVLLKAIRKVLKGQVYVSDELASELVRRITLGPERTILSKIDSLSNRELQVFKLLGLGQTTRDISKNLNISIKTVETHFSRIKQKMKLSNINELIQNAAQWVNSKGFG